MTSASRGAKIAMTVVAGALAVIGMGVLVVFLMLRSTIEVERELAQPFLAIGDDPHLDENYGTLIPNGLGAGLGSVVVIYETEDPDAMIDEIQDVMRVEGWDQSGADGDEWHSGGGDLGHRWGMISIEDDEVRLFIGVIEG